jgi:predicted ArsR family transcriptional regulator
LSLKEIKLGIENPDYGRQMVRQRMEQLIKDGKVKAEKPKEGRAKQLYALP